MPLTAVDYDPFATPAAPAAPAPTAAAPKLTPVDYDPFAVEPTTGRDASGQMLFPSAFIEQPKPTNIVPALIEDATAFLRPGSQVTPPYRPELTDPASAAMAVQLPAPAPPVDLGTLVTEAAQGGLLKTVAGRALAAAETVQSPFAALEGTVLGDLVAAPVAATQGVIDEARLAYELGAIKGNAARAGAINPQTVDQLATMAMADPEGAARLILSVGAESAPGILEAMLTRNPQAATALMGLGSGGTSYGQQRMDGVGIYEALNRATAAGLMEAVGSKATFDEVLAGGSPLLRRAIKAPALEGAGEAGTGAAQAVSEGGDNLADRAMLDAAIGAIVGPVMGVGEAVGGKGPDPIAQAMAAAGPVDSAVIADILRSGQRLTTDTRAGVDGPKWRQAGPDTPVDTPVPAPAQQPVTPGAAVAAPDEEDEAPPIPQPLAGAIDALQAEGLATTPDDLERVINAITSAVVPDQNNAATAAPSVAPAPASATAGGGSPAGAGVIPPTIPGTDTLPPRDITDLGAVAEDTAEPENLNFLRDEIGWAQRGGMLQREAPDAPSTRRGANDDPAAQGGAQGAVIGRTKWIPHGTPFGTESSFWRDRPGRITPAAAQAAMDKHARGERLSKAEQRFIDYAKQTAAEYRVEAQRERDDLAAYDGATQAEAFRRLREDHAVDVADADQEEALALYQLASRAIEAGADEIDVAQASNESDRAYAGRLWQIIRGGRHATDPRAAQEDRAGRREDGRDAAPAVAGDAGPVDLGEAVDERVVPDVEPAAPQPRVAAEPRDAAPVSAPKFETTERETWDDGTVVEFGKTPFQPLKTGERKPLINNSDILGATEREVNLADLVASQPRVTRSGVEKKRDDSHGLPLVVKEGGRIYIQDGHHRLAAQRFAGDTTARVRFIDKDAKAAPAPRATSTKNAVRDAEREARGADPIERAAAKGNEETLAEARATLDADPSAGREVVERLKADGPSVISLADEAVLLVEKVNLRKQRDAAAARASDEAATPSQRAAAKAEWAEAEARLNDMDQATAASGREWGRLGQFRQRMLREDFTFEALERRERVRLERPLTADESKSLREYADRVARLEAKLQETQAALDDATTSVDADVAYKALLAEMAKAMSPFKPTPAKLKENAAASLAALRAAAPVESRALERRAKATPRNGSGVAAVTAAVEAVLGPRASRNVTVVATAADLPANLRSAITPRTEGVYDPQTGHAYVIADRVNTRRAAWVAAHEIAGHLGLRGMLRQLDYDTVRPIGTALDAAFDTLAANPAVTKLADAIAAENKDYDPDRALEEAFAETAAAVRTGNYDGLQRRYGVTVPQAQRATLRGLVARLVAAIKRFFGRGGADVSDAQVYRLLEGAWRHVDTGGGATVDPSRAPQSRQAPTFFSAALRAVQEGKGAPKRADAAAWKGWLDGAVRRGEMKQAERDWLGIDAWLDEQTRLGGKTFEADLVREGRALSPAEKARIAKNPGTVSATITRDELADFIRSNEVKVEDVVLGKGLQNMASLERVFADHGGGFTIDFDPVENEAEYYDPDGEPIDYHDLPAPLRDAVDRASATEAGPAKFGQYTLPGGQNYRELLLTMPERKGEFRGADPQEYFDAGYTVEVTYNSLRDQTDYVVRDADGDWLARRSGARGRVTEAEAMANWLEGHERARRQDADAAQNFTGGHFDQPNVLAHVRFNERTDADGKRVLFIEEIQSDWHQKGRKHGYVGRRGHRPLREIIADMDAVTRELRERTGEYATSEEQLAAHPDLKARHDALYEESVNARSAERGNPTSVPNAPFKGTDEWAMLAFKRAARWAVDNGFDRIAWTTGAQQNERYNLAKQVDSIDAHPPKGDLREVTIYPKSGGPINFFVDADGVVVGGDDGSGTANQQFVDKPLDEVVGKDMAEKIMAVTDPDGHSFKGVELAIGGEGMKGFYDKILPKAVGKWAKPFGATVGKTRLGETTNDDLDTPPPLPAFSPMTAGDLEANAGAENFRDGAWPIKAETRLRVNGVEQLVELGLDRHGVQVTWYDDDGPQGTMVEWDDMGLPEPRSADAARRQFQAAWQQEFWAVDRHDEILPPIERSQPTAHTIDVTDKMRDAVTSGQPLFSRRTDVQTEAKRMGLPATGTTAQVENLVRIAKTNPSEWSRADFEAIAPYLLVHQDMKAGDKDARADAIMRDGLRSGMADNLGDLTTKGRSWTWGGELKDGRAYVLLPNVKRNSGGRLEAGQVPLFSMPTRKGQDGYEAVTGADRWSGGAGILESRAPIDPTTFFHLSRVGAVPVNEGVTDLAAWQERMKADLGPELYASVESAMPQVFEASKMQAVGRQGAERPIDPDNVTHRDVVALARKHIQDGVRGEDAVMKAVTKDVRDVAPAMTERDVRRLFSEYGKVAFPSKEADKVHLRELRSLVQMQESIDRLVAGLPALKSGPQRDKATQAIREKRRVLNDLLKVQMRTNAADPEKLATYQQARITNLQNQIADLEKQIATGERPVRAKPAPPSPEVQALIAERDRLRREKALIDNPKASPDDRFQATQAKSIARQLADVEARLKANDYARRTRPEPKVLNEANKAAKVALMRVKSEFARRQFEDEMSKRHPVRKVFGGAAETLHLSRAYLTSMDFSALLRQGGFIALAHPIRAAKAVPQGLRAFASEAEALAAAEAIFSRPNAHLYKKYGLELTQDGGISLTKMEEQFMSRWLEKVPRFLGGGLVRGSGRAFTAVLNRIRADAFDAMAAALGRDRVLSEAEGKAIANFINVATGRGHIGTRGNAGAAGLNTVFFAPRLVASRFNLLGLQPLYGGTARTRLMIMAEYARFLMGVSVVFALAAAYMAAFGDEDDDPLVTLDPRSSNFLKIKFGNTYIDPMTGLSQVTVFLASVLSGETVTAGGDVRPLRDQYRLTDYAPAFGNGVPLDSEVPYGSPNAFDVTANFARTKFAPLPGAIATLGTGQDVVGNPAQPGDVVVSMVVPISFQDIHGLMTDNGLPTGAGIFALSLLGMGVQYRDPTTDRSIEQRYNAAEADMRKVENELLGRVSRLPEAQWDAEFEKLRAQHPEILDGLSILRYADNDDNQRLGRAGVARRKEDGSLMLRRDEDAAAKPSQVRAVMDRVDAIDDTIRDLRKGDVITLQQLAELQRDGDPLVGSLAAIADMNLDKRRDLSVPATSAERRAVLTELEDMRLEYKRHVLEMIEGSPEEGTEP